LVDYDWRPIFVKGEAPLIFDFLKPKPRKRGKLQPRPDISVNTPTITKVLPDIPDPEPTPDVKSEVSAPPNEPKVIKSKPKPDVSFKRQDSEKEFLRVFQQLTYQHSPWEVWKDFVVMFACTLSNPVDKSHYDEREALYMQTIKKYKKQEQMLFPELAAHTVMALEHNLEQDFLGKIYMQLNLGNDAKAQIFTPYHVSELMAKIATDDVVRHVEERGYLTIHDPCCGAGATLIAGIHEARKQLEKAGLNWQNHVLVAAQDVDSSVALMCYIQLSLLGAAAYVKVGNSLTEPMTPGDTLENYWFTMMYFSDVWSTRRLISKMS
jgi:hypothetical protein